MDKKKAEEKQELAKLFAKNVNEAIHIISEKQGWNDGSPEKTALHSFFAGIEGDLSGNGFMSGALAGGVNEAAMAKLMKTLGPNNPDLVQIASAALGYATNKLVGEDALAGAALAQWGTKWNELVQYLGNSEKKNVRETGAVVELAKRIYSNMSDEEKRKLSADLAKGLTVRTLEYLSKKTREIIPEMEQKYPGSFSATDEMVLVNRLLTVLGVYYNLVEFKYETRPKN